VKAIVLKQGPGELHRSYVKCTNDFLFPCTNPGVAKTQRKLFIKEIKLL